MAAQAPEGEGPAPARPSRIRVMRPEVEEVLKSPRRGRAKLHKEGGGEQEDDAGARPRYDCPFQDEEKEGQQGFAPPDVVWCKVRSHPWWPAQVFDAADASELALRHARPGAPLVAYFWDRTFAWMDPSVLRPFRAHFPRLAAQSTVSSYVAAVDAALQEVTRRIEAGLSCSCSPPTVARKQQIQNTGIREGAYGAVVDEVYMRDSFRAKPFVDYISALGRSPLAGADRLDLATAMAQLRSFNRLRCPMELPEFVIYQGIEDVAAAVAPEAEAEAEADVAATQQTKRKRTEEKGGGDGDAPAKEKRSRHGGESSSRKRDAPAKEPEVAIDVEDSPPMPRDRIMDTSEDAADKGEAPANKDAAIVEDTPMPSTKHRKSKRGSKTSAEKKKKDTSKDTADKGESQPEAEPAKEDDVNGDSSMPSVEVTDDTLSKQRKSKRVSKSAAESKKKDTSKDTADKGESLPEAEPAKEVTENEDSSMPSAEATDDTVSKGRKSKKSKGSAKTKKRDADKNESVPEPAKDVAENEDSSMPSAEAIDGALSKETNSKSSTRSAKKKKKKDAGKKESLPDPAKEGAENKDSSMPSGGATDGALSKETNSKISTRSAKKKKKESLPEPAKEKATGTGSSTPSRVAADDTPSKKRKSSKKSSASNRIIDTSMDAVDGMLSERKSGRRLRSSHKIVEALEVMKWPRKKDAGETTKVKDKDAALPKENNLGRRAGSARHKDKTTITKDGDGLRVSPLKKRLHLDVHSATENAPFAVSELGRKKKTLIELLAETATPNPSAGGKSKARAERPLPSSILKPEATPNTRGKRSLPASTETPEDPGRDKDTMNTREKRSVASSTEKPERDTRSTVKTRGKSSLPSSAEEPEDPDRDKNDTMKTRGKRSLPASAEKRQDPDRGTKGTAKTRGKRSLPESTEDPDRVTKGSSKTKGKGSLPESTEEPEGPDDRDMKDSMHTRKRKKLDTLGDLSSQPQPVSPKGSTKAREVKRKAAGQKSQASPVVKANGGISGDTSSKRSARRKAAEPKPQETPVVKANGEASQTRSRRAKNSEVTVPDKSPRSVKLDKGKKGAVAEDSPSCGEMLSQLCVGASDAEKMGKIAPASASFLTDFLKSARACTSDVEEAANTGCRASSPDADEEIPEKAAADKVSSPNADEEMPEEAAADEISSPHAVEEIPEKATDNVSSPHADLEVPEEAADKVSSPHADDEVIPEEAAEKVSSPSADEAIPEEAAEKVSSPNADEVMPEKAADEVSSVPANEATPEKAAEKVSSPNADEVIPEEAAEKAIPEEAADEVSLAPADEETLLKVKEEVSSPLADEETLEKATTENVSSATADEETLETAAAEKVSSAPADEETPETAATEKVSNAPAGEETLEKVKEEVSSPHADEAIPEKAAEKVSSPHADEATPEKAADEVSSPPADVETPEKATEKVCCPPADEEIAEKPSDKVSSPHAEAEMSEKAAKSSPAPSEPPVVCDDMKDNYWSDILINVEEPLSSLAKKKDKGKMRSSKKQRRDDEMKQDEMLLAEAENGKANGAEEDVSLTGLVLHFSKPGAVPSRGDLIEIFSQYGPVSEARTETDEHSSSAQVVFRRRADAEAAFGGAGKIVALRPGLDSFRLTDFPCATAAFRVEDGPKQG
uniref:PWWP domain-containing protein n=1 Tax=Aegilops tauschii subsp. strangulata TaxID=200361 RepID=A0A453GXC2_AEGTS